MWLLMRKQNIQFLTQRFNCILVQGQGLKSFSILAVLEFTPERKRMSIICKEHKGRYYFAL
jgi:magnesium-transporting ATPase (P-type)